MEEHSRRDARDLLNFERLRYVHTREYCKPINLIPADPSRRSGASDRKESHMMLTTTDGTEIFYKDWGTGQPLFFHHGWPLSADDWDNQLLFFLKHGYRVIAHDRRGHGRSTQTAHGN